MSEPKIAVLLSESEDDPIRYLDFVREYRKIRNLPLGGTRKNCSKYNDLTSRYVLSVGSLDDRGQLPVRVTLSTFKLSHPITSYGCIVRCTHKGENYYLLVRRPDTIEYSDLIRGIYRESQLYFILRSLSSEERKRLLEYDFDTLWSDQMGGLADTTIYRWAKQQFNRLAPHMKEILDLVPSIDPEGKNRWLFPKGRLEYHMGSRCLPIPESPWECALREFKEETNNLQIDYTFLLPNPVQELFFGSNSKNYATNYFVLNSSEMVSPIQFPRRVTPIREITTSEVEEIVWVSQNDISRYLPPIRLELIRQLEAWFSANTAGPVELHPNWEKPADSNEIPVDEI